MEKKRIFAAIDISDEARERVASYISKLQNGYKNVPVRWEKPEKLHITIKFVGRIDETELTVFTERVKSAASKMTPFEITIAVTGAFINRSSRANVLWLGLTSDLPNGSEGMIENLAAAIDHEKGRSSERRYKPHLTIARFKDLKKARDLIERHMNTTFERVSFNARDITIYESTLLPTGSAYRVLSKQRLGSG